MEQEIKTKTPKLDLEEPEMEEITLEDIHDPVNLEESKRRLHELSLKIDEQMRMSKMTVKKLFSEIQQERGMKKITGVFKHVSEFFSSQFQDSTMENSIKFVRTTLNTFQDYNKEIPKHIQSFQQTLIQLRKLQKDSVAKFNNTKKELKAKIKEHEDIKKKMESTKSDELKEELKVQEQEFQNELQNIDLKMRRHSMDLKNANLTADLYLSLKGSYEILLRQVEFFILGLKRHEQNLAIIGPSVSEVQKIVQTFDRFSQAIDEYKKRDNLTVRYSTEAVKMITPTIQDSSKPWFNEKTTKIVEKNRKEAAEITKKAFGPNIPSLEDYNILTGEVEKDEMD